MSQAVKTYLAFKDVGFGSLLLEYRRKKPGPGSNSDVLYITAPSEMR